MAYYFWLGADWSPLCSPDEDMLESSWFDGFVLWGTKTIRPKQRIEADGFITVHPKV